MRTPKLMHVAVAGLLLVGGGLSTGAASDTARVAAAAEEEGWDVVSVVPATDRYYDEDLDQWIESSGYVVTSVPEASKGTEAGALAGCEKSGYYSTPKKVQSTTTPYYNYVTANAWKQLSSGCPYNENVYAQLWENYDFGANKKAESVRPVTPGGARVYVTVNYRCGSDTHNYQNVTSQGASGNVRLCP